MTGPDKHFICRVDEIELPGSREFSIKQEKHSVEGFVIRHHGGVSVYVNQCPHTGASLNWQPDQFLSFDNAFIQCSIHGALFQLDNGLCVRGPCIGRSLEKLPYVLDSDRILVDLTGK